VNEYEKIIPTLEKQNNFDPRTIEVFILYLFAVIDNFEKIINKKKKKTRKSWISPS